MLRRVHFVLNNLSWQVRPCARTVIDLEERAMRIWDGLERDIYRVRVAMYVSLVIV